MSHVEDLLKRVENEVVVVGVVGLGYVGLPVIVAFGEAGFQVRGFDVDAEKIGALRAGNSYVGDVQSSRVAGLIDKGLMQVGDETGVLDGADVILMCVPTPLLGGAPDLSRVTSASAAVAPFIRPGSLVVLESTTYPGTTEEIVRPLLEAGGLSADGDFFLAFSPERIDPGNQSYGFADIPKVVGGINHEAAAVAAALYEKVVGKVVVVSSTREAELSKLIENTFRHVNIALVNELAIYAHEMGIDIWEAIDAAASKPFGFMPFWPGPGWGGHCIPLDPTFLSWRVRRHRSHEVRFVELAQTVNGEMGRHVTERCALLLNDSAKAIRGSRILGIGVAYKPGIDDVRESPGLKILEELHRRGAAVTYHDPLVPLVSLGDGHQRSVELDSGLLGQQDLVVVFTRQEGVDWPLIEEAAPLIFDCCNALGRASTKVVRL